MKKGVRNYGFFSIIVLGYLFISFFWVGMLTAITIDDLTDRKLRRKYKLYLILLIFLFAIFWLPVIVYNFLKELGD